MTSNQIINGDLGDEDQKSVLSGNPDKLQLSLSPVSTSHGSLVHSSSFHHAGQAVEAGGICILPLELLVEVFKASIDLGVPRVNIALINKYCNAALISSPSLWTHITLWLSTSRGNIRGYRMPHLVRCLELSQMHPLRVRMNSEPLEFVAQSTWTLSSVLHLCDTPRWESLTINHGGSGGEVLKEFKFPSLRSLSFIDAGSWNETSFSRGIFCALLQSRAKIKETIIPEVIFQSMPAGFDLHSLRIATTSAIVASKLLSSYSLQVLHITGPPSTLCHLKGIQLPLTVSMSSASTCTLMELRLERTQHLTIKNLQGELMIEDATIACPELRSLSLIESGFFSLVHIAAPKLVDLCIGTENVEIASYRNPISTADVVTLLRDFRRYLKCQPRFLTTRLPLTTEEAILLLEGWPQLEKVSIKVERPFRWRTWLAEGLVRKRRIWDAALDHGTVQETWKICPQLRRLHLATDWDEGEGTEWERHVKRIFRDRGGSGLEYVSWTCANGKEFVHSRDR